MFLVLQFLWNHYCNCTWHEWIIVAISYLCKVVCSNCKLYYREKVDFVIEYNSSFRELHWNKISLFFTFRIFMIVCVFMQCSVAILVQCIEGLNVLSAINALPFFLIFTPPCCCSHWICTNTQWYDPPLCLQKQCLQVTDELWGKYVIALLFEACFIYFSITWVRLAIYHV